MTKDDLQDELQKEELLIKDKDGVLVVPSDKVYKMMRKAFRLQKDTDDICRAPPMPPPPVQIPTICASSVVFLNPRGGPDSAMAFLWQCHCNAMAIP